MRGFNNRRLPDPICITWRCSGRVESAASSRNDIKCYRYKIRTRKLVASTGPCHKLAADALQHAYIGYYWCSEDHKVGVKYGSSN